MFTRWLLTALLAGACLTLPAEEPVFGYVEPLRSVNKELPPSLQDIESRLPPDHGLHDADFITWAHEGTHGIDSRHSRSPTRAFYVLRGRVARFRHPKLSIANVAAAVPEPLRGKIYKHYLSTQLKWWNEEPLYLVHEWVAYTNGAQVRKELGWAKRAETEAHMAEMGVYVSVLVSLTATEDPTYDLGPLVAFIRWNVARGREIAGDRWNGLPAFVSAVEATYAPAMDLMDLVSKD